MSELISNSTFEPETADSVHLPADTGPAESAPTEVVVRYRPNADSSDQRDSFEGDEDPNESKTISKPNRGSRARWGRVRALAGVLGRGFAAMTKAGIRGAVRYPRSSAVAALSLLILGAILRTQPDKPTPTAKIDTNPSAQSPSEKKEKDEKKGSAVNVGPIVDNAPHPTAKIEGRSANERGQAPVSPSDSAPNPFPPLPDGAVAQGQTQPSTENPRTENGASSTNQVAAPSPPRMAEQGDPTILTSSISDPVPAPLLPTASSPTPAASTPDPGTTKSTPSDSGPESPAPAPSLVAIPQDTMPELPPAPSSSPGPSPAPTPNQPADLVPPPLGEELTLTRGSESPDSSATPPTTVAGGSPSEPAKASATSPNPGSAMPPTAAPRPEQTKTETIPKPSESQDRIPEKPAARPETPKPNAQAPQSTSPSPEPPKDAPTPKPEPQKSEPPKDAPTPKPEIPGSKPPQPNAPTSVTGPSVSATTTVPKPSKVEAPATTPEISRSGQIAPPTASEIQDLKTESGAAKPDARLELGNPLAEQAIPKPDGPEPQIIPGVDPSRPGLLKAEDLTSGTGAMNPRSQGPVDQPKAQAPESLDPQPKVEEAPNQPGNSAPVPVSERPVPRTQDMPPRNESVRTRPDEPTEGAPDSSPSALPDKSVAKQVRLPNTGKISDVVRDRFDPLGGAASTSPELSRDARAHADKNLSFAAESSRDLPIARLSRGADPAENHSPRRPAGPDLTVGSRLPNEPRSEVGSPRVESVPHIVERDENFWTISRLYYNSGRYYRALWKANEQKFPKIDGLHVNDVIVIPPVEDLDAASIDPPRVSNGSR